MNEVIAPFTGAAIGEQWPQVNSAHHELLAGVMNEHGYSYVTVRRSSHEVYLLEGKSDDGGLVVKCENPDAPDRNLAAEKAALELLADHPDPPLSIPRLVSYDPEQNVIISTRLPGDVNRMSVLGAWNYPSRVQKIGRQAAHHIAWIGSIDKDVYEKKMADSSPASPWDTMIARYLADFLPKVADRYPTMARLGAATLKTLKYYYPDGLDCATEQVVHSDFRPDNALFDWQDNLIGAIDFELLALEDAARAMRGFYTGDERAIEACIDEYESLTKQAVPIGKVAAMATVHSLITIAYQLKHNLPTLKWFAFGQHRLMEMFPDEDWSELFAAVTENYVPAEGHWDEDVWQGDFGKFQVSPGADAPERRKLTRRDLFNVISLSDAVLQARVSAGDYRW